MLHNLASGFSLLALRRLPAASFVRSFDQLIALLILDLLVWAGLDTLHAATGTQLMLDGLLAWACYLLLALFGCALVARAQDRDTDTRALLIPALSVAPYVLVLFWLASDTLAVRQRPVLALLAGLAYLAALGVRIVTAAYGVARTRAAALAVALIVAAPWISTALDLDTRLWVPEEGSTEQGSDESLSEESLFYDQPARIAAAVERIAPRTGNAPQIFFVGFAGDGDQGIFKREALFAAQMFADRYGSGERSVELINDVEDRDSYPIASVSGLQQTLKLLAERMDPQQDVLVLTLTSHGSREGLAVTNGNLPLLQLGPADLRQVLDEAGIKWRVLVVSACYAGVFVEPLKTDTTLIMTAADAEHTSFGCADDRELTYFGEALLKDSLPRADSLEAAFRQAAEIIQRRESAEHLEHSNPQLYVGPAMREKLQELQSGPHPEHPGTSVIVRR